MPPLVTLQLHYRGPVAPDAAREALGAALTALGAPQAPWERLTWRALDDRNGPGGVCFEGTWRRGEATLAMSCASGEGNPRDGWGYEHRGELAWGDLRARWSQGDTAPEMYALTLEVTTTPEGFRAVRRALGERFGGDDTDAPWVAASNLRALRGVDVSLQRELLRAALARGDAGASAWGSLLAWKEELLGGGLDERLREAPSDVSAWTRALELPPEGWSPSRVARGLARLVPWAAERAATEVARAWTSHPLLGLGDALAPGWHELDDGTGPGWSRKALAGAVIRDLFGHTGLASAHDGEAITLHTAGGARGWGVPRAAWCGAELPRVHARCDVTLAGATAREAHFHWIWGDGDEDVLVLVEEQAERVALGTGMFLAGGEDFRRRALRALHASAPFAWRPVAALFEERAARAWVTGPVDLTRVLEAMEALGGVAGEVFDALRSCACERGAPCPHRAVLRAARKAVLPPRRQGDDEREVWLGRARQECLDAALDVLDGADAAPKLARSMRSRAVSAAVVPAPT